MEYTVQALAELSGVTPRTLRWYDRIGLLKPGRVGENGYRYYGPAQVDRLQDILYYRALGVPLDQIRASLDDPSFDRLAALRGHLAALEGERERLEGLIRSVKTTIRKQERSEIMTRRNLRPSSNGPWTGMSESTAGRPGRSTGTEWWTPPSTRCWI